MYIFACAQLINSLYKTIKKSNYIGTKGAAYIAAVRKIKSLIYNRTNFGLQKFMNMKKIKLQNFLLFTKQMKKIKIVLMILNME